ncbi:MAG: sigma factor-like helix-turn-helix DNA-binding protein [Clostridiales bacterium]|nr:sigma factor-like helix-turn-helix DNA-binding protein [Clostridiales bacterium]
MAKDLTVSMLLDFYGELLTEKQLSALDGYYNQDLSLAEIAEEMQVSRQGVRAVIKQGEAHLAEFEEKLHMAERFSEISRLAEEMRGIIMKMQPNELTKQLADKVEDIKSKM